MNTYKKRSRSKSTAARPASRLRVELIALGCIGRRGGDVREELRLEHDVAIGCKAQHRVGMRRPLEGLRPRAQRSPIPHRVTALRLAPVGSANVLG